MYSIKILQLIHNVKKCYPNFKHDISKILRILTEKKHLQIRNLEVDGYPLKENLFGQSALLMNAAYTVFP